jgi:VWFA-related protein
MAGEIGTIMAMKRSILSCLALLLWIPTIARPEDQTSPTFAVSVNLIKVPLTVFNANGAIVPDLHREDFRLYEDGKLQQIRSFGVDKNPVSVVLLLDTSATLKEELKKIKEAAEQFAEALAPEDRISVIAFDDEVTLIQDWTNRPQQVHKALRKVESGIRTALYDAMFTAASDRLEGIDGRKAIILLTDCLNNQSSVGFLEAAQAIVQSQATLFVVSKTVMVRQAAYKQRRVIMLSDIYKRLFGDGNYIEEFFQKREEEMIGLAEKTGGRCFFPTDYDQIKGIYTEVARELKSKYFLTYISSQGKSPNSFHRIGLEYLLPASQLIYRQGYYFEPEPIHKRRY